MKSANYKLIFTPEEFELALKGCPDVLVADVETAGQTVNIDGLLGVALAYQDRGQIFSFYVVLNSYDSSTERLLPTPNRNSVSERLSALLGASNLIGHNVPYDKKWIDGVFGLDTNWICDTRILWHLLDDRQIERGYGLKTAQTKVLGWPSSNEDALEMAVKARGGKLKDGDHYLAPVGILGQYACLDAFATYELYLHFKNEAERLNYWGFINQIQDYQILLSQCTATGVEVSVEELIRAEVMLSSKAEELETKISEICREEIDKLQRRWLVEKASDYTSPCGVMNFLANPERYPKFNHNSNTQKIALFYDMLQIPVTERTPSGQPKVDKATVASFSHPSAKPFVELAETQKLLSMTTSYLECVEQGKIHFPYNICGTVSGRLGGFKPYALNLPFEAKELMSAFKVSKGFIGIHSDLKSVEPCFIAHYSKDPTLLKVHRDGLGDVYLDFAKIAFPHNKELQALYNPNEVCSDEIKKLFKKERNACKIVHLALGYTGTAVTVAKSLTKAGFPTDAGEAQRLVNAYWQLFFRVKDFSERCKQAIGKNGMLINPFGRIIQIPREFRKDTMNRLVQSTAHDALMSWVKEIDKQRQLLLPSMSPLLVDTHDSTTWQCPEGDYELAKKIFEDSLRTVNSRLSISVNLSAETKPFHTFYGLKNSEE